MLQVDRQRRRQTAVLSEHSNNLTVLDKLCRAWTLIDQLHRKNRCHWSLLFHWIEKTNRFIGAKLMRRHALTHIVPSRCKRRQVISVVQKMLTKERRRLQVLQYLWTIAPPGGRDFRTFDVSCLVRFACRLPDKSLTMEQVVDQFHLHQLLLLQIELQPSADRLCKR